MNRSGKTDDGSDGDGSWSPSSTKMSAGGIDGCQVPATSQESGHSRNSIDASGLSNQESLNNPMTYEDANSTEVQEVGKESLSQSSDLADRCPVAVTDRLTHLNKSYSFPQCDDALRRRQDDVKPNVGALMPKSNGSKTAASQSSIPKASSSLHMDVDQEKVCLVLNHHDDYTPDDVTLVSSTNGPSQAANSPEAGIDSASLDWSLSTDSTTTAMTGYSYVAMHDEVRPLNSGQLSDSSGKQSRGSSSPPALTRVQSNSRISSDKKKKTFWYNALSPTYKSRSEDFKRIFKDIPSDERLIVDYSCALQKEILIHGRLYITQNSICFYANIFRWETILTLRCKDITSMTKEKTARVIPNAIQICTKDDKYFFTSFGTRDKTYLMLFRVWQNALVDHPMSPQELWQWVHYSYGEELGLNSSDEDYVQPSTEDEHAFSSRVQQEERIAAVLEGVGVPNKDDTDSYSEPLTNGDILPNCNSEINNTASINNVDVGEKHHVSSAPRSVTANNMDTTSPDMPTDVGDTSEDDEEVPCNGHEHLDIPVVEAEYNFSVDKLFEMIFTDSDLYRHFTEVKKTTELVQSQWSEDVDSQGDRHRVISYTLSLNYSIGPKTSPATEKQILRSVSKPGAFYLVDTECINSSIPYGDNFYVVNRYCLNRLGLNRCRLKITSAVRYRKSVWGVVKSFIEKNVTNGIIESFTCLADLLHEESTILGQEISLGPCVGKKKVLRRRRNVSDRTQSIKHSNETRAQPTHGPGSPAKTHTQKVQGVSSSKRDDRQKTTSLDVLVRVICAVLIVLAVFSSLLFYKLWSLEKKMTPFHLIKTDLWKNINEMPKSQEEWKQLLEWQRELHQSEIEQWRDVLSTSAKLLNKLQLMMESLEQEITAKYQHRTQDTQDKNSIRHDEH